jgi:predicted O-methyltransferase YrrM
MSSKSFLIPDRLYDYYRTIALRDAPLLAELGTINDGIERGGMQVSPEQGQFLQLLVRATGAKRCLEIGVFTGYSSLCVALALPADGTLIACDVSAEWTTIARGFWRRAGVEPKIDLRIAPAIETLDQLLAEGRHGSFDFAFIDADKPNYWNYFERALELVRPGGLIGIDNTLWSGRPADASDPSENTVAIRAFNEKLHADQRVMISVLPIGDGLTLALKTQ